MKRLKLALTYALAIFCVFTFLTKNTSEHFVFQPQEIKEIVMFYMLNEENQLVPVSINYELSDLEEEKVSQVIHLMMQDFEYFELQKVLPSSLNLIDVEIEGELVQLHFNQAIVALDRKIELRVIEAIVGSLVLLNENYQIEFWCENELIQTMPLSQRIMKRFDICLGVNNQLSSASLHNSQAFYVLYKNSEESYYEIETRRFSKEISEVEFVNKILQASSSQLECLNVVDDGDVAILYLNQAFLMEENVLDIRKIEEVMLSMKMNQMADKFDLRVGKDGEITQFKEIVDFEKIEINRIE